MAWSISFPDPSFPAAACIHTEAVPTANYDGWLSYALIGVSLLPYYAARSKFSNPPMFSEGESRTMEMFVN